MLPLLVLIIALSFPQGDTGQLTGTIVDPNNAAIPNAVVKLTSQRIRRDAIRILG